MRRRFVLILLPVGIGVAACQGVAQRAGPATTDVVLDSSAIGATLVLSGILSQESFALNSMRVIGSRLAGRSSDPDEFRLQLLDRSGRELTLLKMWSPLLRHEWDSSGEQESAHVLDRHDVQIPVPVSILVNQVVLSWPNGREIARINVDRAIRTFCLQNPQNQACKL